MSTFKHGVMMLRRGKPPFRTEDTSFDDATEHTGTIVAGSALGFIVCMFALGIPLTILFLPILWRIILRIWFLFIILAIVIAIYVFINKLAEKLILVPENGGVSNRKNWSYFELFKFYSGLSEGLMAALTRLITLVVVSPFLALRADASMFPEWLASVLPDPAYKAFRSLIVSYHIHNNPIAATFADFLLEEVYPTQ
eukprot:TRINITY_DN7867_c0_g1_i1.p1 TRINITY_DN7867_c0_g1~~TRINITY_DN7867_c0_g1_i1.p1  ORF type:complete len:197 (-),score=31.48 TRINITY_DN7867_c0_g1_i1:263-853(-)